MTPLWPKTSQLIAWLSFKGGWKWSWNKDLVLKTHLKNYVKERNLILKSSSRSVSYQNYSSWGLVLALVNFIWALPSLTGTSSPILQDWIVVKLSDESRKAKQPQPMLYRRGYNILWSLAYSASLKHSLISQKEAKNPEWPNTDVLALLYAVSFSFSELCTPSPLKDIETHNVKQPYIIKHFLFHIATAPPEFMHYIHQQKCICAWNKRLRDRNVSVFTTISLKFRTH